MSIIKDSNAVERDRLEPGKAYMQLTYVEPYFDAFELRNRNTYFERNYNISKCAALSQCYTHRHSDLDLISLR